MTFEQMKSRYKINNIKEFVDKRHELGLPEGWYNVDKPDGRIYTDPDGQYEYPSVTTVLNATTNKDWLDAWRARIGDKAADQIVKNASARGTAFHEMAEQYLSNEPITSRHGLGYKMFLEAKPTLDKIDNVLCLEGAVYSHRLKIAGRIDAVAEFDGIPALIDFKTSRKVKKKVDIKNYFLQTSLYATMLNELTGTDIDQIYIIMACETGEQLLFEGFRFDYIEEAEAVVAKYWKERE